MRLIRSYFTGGLVLVASLFMIQNIVIVIFWSKLYVAGPSIKGIVDACCSLLVCDKCGTICWPCCPAVDKQKVDPARLQRHSFMIALFNKMRFPKRTSQELIQKKPIMIIQKNNRYLAIEKP